MTLHPVYHASREWLSAAADKVSAPALADFIGALQLQYQRQLTVYRNANGRIRGLSKGAAQDAKELRRASQHDLQVLAQVLRSAKALRQQLVLQAQGLTVQVNKSQVAEVLLMFALRTLREGLRLPLRAQDSWQQANRAKFLLLPHAIRAEQLLSAHPDLFPPLPAVLHGQRKGLAEIVRQCEYSEFLNAKMAFKNRIAAEMVLTNDERRLLDRCL